MKMENFSNLATSSLRKTALKIAEAGLEAIDTERVIRRVVQFDGSTLVVAGERFESSLVGKVVVAGVGKCSARAAETLEQILGERLEGGVVLDVRKIDTLQKIEVIEGTHPLPSEENVRGAAAIVGTLRGLKKNDLVIFIVSGGGSTLLCLPEDVACEEEGKILETLTRAGATIQEINAVRKHLSLARGGYLAKHAYPARMVSLIFSDVPGDDIQFVASGPTVKDTTTVEDAAAILAKYDVLRACGIKNCGLVETPKENKYFERVRNVVAVSNTAALEAMKSKAEEEGYAAEICTACLSGEAREVGKEIVEKLHKAKSKTAFLYGGETTVTVKGHGRGGRNLELALSALRFVKKGEIILSVASDGRDNGEFAGAICDIMTKRKADEMNVDIKAHLDENNEYPFFEETGNYLMTGDTGSNVSDLVIALKE